MKGTVTKSTGSWYSIKGEDGTFVEARIVGKFRIKGLRTTNPVAVGDIVEYDAVEDGTAVIKKIEERENYIIRKSTNLSKQAHIIAANVDQAVLMVTFAIPETSLGFIDRFLVTAEAYHIPVVILINKMDMYEPEHLEYVDEIIDLYESIGYPCIPTSADDGFNLEAVKELLTGKISLLAGHSGVGKSTLINAIEPELDLKTSDISEWSLKGKHTTTFAEMFDLSFGGSVIDSPGIKGFGMIDLEKEDLSHRFPEMRERMDACKFHNCVHINEPGCAIRAAVESGEIAASRYHSYLSMYEEDQSQKYR